MSENKQDDLFARVLAMPHDERDALLKKVSAGPLAAHVDHAATHSIDALLAPMRQQAEDMKAIRDAAGRLADDLAKLRGSVLAKDRVPVPDPAEATMRDIQGMADRWLAQPMPLPFELLAQARSAGTA